jgi:hypothetical protein
MSRSTETAHPFDFLGPDPLLPRTDQDAEPTLTISPADRLRILARAFETMDDDPTLKMPVPSIPDDVPSPTSVPRPPVDGAKVALPSPAALNALRYGRPSADASVHPVAIGLLSFAVAMVSALLAYAMQG